MRGSCSSTTMPPHTCFDHRVRQYKPSPLTHWGLDKQIHWWAMQRKHGSDGASATPDTSHFGFRSHHRHETLPKGESNFRLCPNRGRTHISCGPVSAIAHWISGLRINVQSRRFSPSAVSGHAQDWHAMIECQKSYHFLGSFGVLPQLLHPCAGEVRSCDYEGTRSQDLNQGWLFPKIAQIFWPNEVRPRPRSRGLPTLLHEIPQELSWPHNLTYFALIFTKPLARLDKPTKFRWTRWYLHIYFIAVVILTLIL